MKELTMSFGKEDMSHFKEVVHSESHESEFITLTGTAQAELVIEANSPVVRLNPGDVQHLAGLLLDFSKEALDDTTYSMKAFAEKTLKPLGERVVVRPIDQQVTEGGIILPASVEPDKPREGHIVAVGPGRMLKDGSYAPMSVQVGQRILFGRFAPSDFKINGEELLVVAESDILAVVSTQFSSEELVSLPDYDPLLELNAEELQNAQSLEARIVTHDNGSVWLATTVTYAADHCLTAMSPLNTQAHADAQQNAEFCNQESSHVR